MGDGSVVERVAAACERAQTVFFVVAGGAFLVSFGFAGTGRFRTLVLTAVALFGAGFLCGAGSALRDPEEMVGNTVNSEAGMFGEPGRIRTRSEARLVSWLFAGIGLVLLVVGSFGALSTF